MIRVINVQFQRGENTGNTFELVCIFAADIEGFPQARYATLNLMG